jgi:hypothetical protein
VLFDGVAFHHQEELIAAIVAASIVEPHFGELRHCVQDLMSKKIPMLSQAKRGRFVWHISKGKIIPSGKTTSKTCSLFGLLDEVTGFPMITAVGAHGRGTKAYTIKHWHDSKRDSGKKSFEL